MLPKRRFYAEKIKHTAQATQSNVTFFSINLGDVRQPPYSNKRYVVSFPVPLVEPSVECCYLKIQLNWHDDKLYWLKLNIKKLLVRRCCVVIKRRSFFRSWSPINQWNERKKNFQTKCVVAHNLPFNGQHRREESFNFESSVKKKIEGKKKLFSVVGRQSGGDNRPKNDKRNMKMCASNAQLVFV